MTIRGFGKATKQMIDEFEKHIGFALPQDYREFLMEYNGGSTDNRYPSIFVKEIQESIPLHVLCGLNVPHLDLYQWNDEYRSDLLPNSLIIGHDPSECMIVMICDSKDKGVYAWDHSWYFPQSSEESNIYWMAGSFSEFMKALKEPEDG